MQTVLLNIGVLCFCLSIWSAAGIGPVLLLAPKTRLLSWLLLSPLIGLMLISSLGVARIEFFLVPVNPLLDVSMLTVVGLVVVYLRRKRVGRRFGTCYWSLLRLSGPYLAFLVLFALVFGSNGFETLSTGSDEVAYGMMEEQIIQNVHRGTPDDNPIMRLDHYIQDYPIRELTYLKNNRRGVDMLTVSTAMLLRVSPQRVYPVTFGCLTLVLAMGVLFLCRQAFNMKLRRAWPVPIFFLCCGGLWTLHLQGNFTNLSSWALFLLAPFFLIQALTRVRLRWVFPLALMVASVYSFYYEPAFVSLGLPFCFAMLYSILWRRTSAVKIVALVVLLCALVLIFHPTISEKLAQALTIAKSARTGFIPPAIVQDRPAVMSWLVRPFADWFRLAHSDWWPYSADVLFGIGSPIDVSALNALVRNTLLGMPVPSLLGIYLTAAVSCFGLLKGCRPVGVFASIVMLAWLAAAHLFVIQKSFFAFYRSIMYVMPFVVLGLGLAFCRAREILGRSSSAIRYTAAVPLLASAAFLFINSFSSAALGAYVYSHSVYNDAYIRRLNPDAAVWQVLRATLSESHRPVMISGFSEPPRIFWLASGIKPLAHFMGKSTSDKWLFGVHATPNEPFYPTQYPTPKNDWIRQGFGGGTGYYVRGSSADLMPIVEKQNIPWNQVYPKFLAESEISMVPIRHGWPVEWPNRTDILGPTTVEFPNICDVVYRYRDAVSVSGGSLGPIKNDERGHYREISGDTEITARTQLGWSEISIVFDGAAKDVALAGQPLTRVDWTQQTKGVTESVFRLREPVQSVTLTLTGKAGARIRDISMRLVPASLGYRPSFEP